MTAVTRVALVILGLALGFILAYVLGAGNSLNLFVGLMLAMAGALVGFIAEWLVDEAYRKNRELARRLDERAAITSLPAVEAGGDGAAGDTASPGVLHQREEEVRLLLEQVTGLQTRQETLRAEFENYQRTHPDNLTVIKGIGPIYQWKLRDVGIHTFQQLAQANPDMLRRRLGVKNWQRVDVVSWVEQARDWVKEVVNVDRQPA